MKKFLPFLLFLPLVCHGIEPFPGLTKTSKSEYKNFMHTGFHFPAVLETSIFSFNIETPVIALVEYDIVFRDKVVLPAGTKLIGVASIVKTIDRVNVVFNTIVFPDGQEISFTGLALNTDGSAGIPGKISNKGKVLIPAQVILGAATAGAQVVNPIAGGAMNQISNVAQEEFRKAQQYSITVKKGTPIEVYVVNRIEY